LTEPQQPQRQHDPNPRSNIPVPDPSLLTTEALDREIGHLRELIGGRVDELAKDFDRFKEAHIERHADAVDKAIEHLEDICEVKFESIKMQFHERDLRFQNIEDAGRAAVAAALQAAKEAVEKSERGFEKELDAIKLLITNQGKAQDLQIRDLKDRAATGEGKGAGLNQAWLIGVAAIGTLISVAILLINAVGT
jgi:hypothetical protein